MTHTLALEIDHAQEHAGWIDCWLTIDGQRRHLSASNVCPPFLSLLHFVKAVAGQRLPTRFLWDEEGKGMEFKARPVAEDSHLVHLTIQPWGQDNLLLDAEIERDTVVQAFLPPLQNLAENFALAEAEWGLPGFAVQHVAHRIAEGFLSIPDEYADEQLEFLILRRNYPGVTCGVSSLHIWMEDEGKTGWPIRDADPFWPEWIVFLEKIAGGDLPVTIEHVQESTLLLSLYAEGDVPEDMKDLMEYHTCLQADPADAPQRFRLRIHGANRNGMNETLLLDDVFDRRHFVRTFRQAFESFLKNKYQFRPDAAGQVFDLRTLPLDKLA